MTVNTILGLPTIREGELEPRWAKQEYISHVYQTRFPIEYVATKRADIPKSKQSTIENDKKVSWNLHVTNKTQELSGYELTVVHQPSRMMVNADALSRKS